MRKQEFLERLEQALSGLPEQDRGTLTLARKIVRGLKFLFLRKENSK